MRTVFSRVTAITLALIFSLSAVLCIANAAVYPVGSVEKTWVGLDNADDLFYYFDSEGVSVTGEQIIDGYKYVFCEDGSLEEPLPEGSEYPPIPR